MKIDFSWEQNKKALIGVFVMLAIITTINFGRIFDEKEADSTQEISEQKMTQGDVPFEKKQQCASYQPAMRKQIEDFHGIEITYELGEVFYSKAHNSCLYSYAFLLGNGNQVFMLKDYLTNRLVAESPQVDFYDNEARQNFEKEINKQR